MLKRIPNTFVLIFSFIVMAAVATWIIPGGEFDRKKEQIGELTKEIVVPGSFKKVASQGQSWQIFRAFYDGFERRADIIVFIFIVGGAFTIIQQTRSIETGIDAFTRRAQGKERLTLALIMLVFGVFGSVFGMSEETIPFVLIFVPLAISMGYDSLVGVSLCFVAAGIGFAGATFNPFTVGIAQGIAQVEVFSGLTFRLFVFAGAMTIGIWYVLRYATRVKLNPQISPMYKLDQYWRDWIHKEGESGSAGHDDAASHARVWIVFAVVVISAVSSIVFVPVSHFKLGATFDAAVPATTIVGVLLTVTSVVAIKIHRHYFILNLLAFTVVYLIVGVVGHGWYIAEIAALFFALGIVAGLTEGYSGDVIVKSFFEGVKDIASAALIVGFASGIIVILENGKVIDSILYYISGAFDGLHDVLAVEAMFVFQTIINLFVPSGSGQAALTMPLMAPLADLLGDGVSRQTAVLAYQLGDGFTNLIIPTAGVLIGCLGMARIPYEIWVGWMWRLQVLFFIFAMLMLMLPVIFSIPDF